MLILITHLINSYFAAYKQLITLLLQTNLAVPMESNVLTVVLLPLAIGIIMMGLGLSLTPDDFKRIVIYPKAVIVGLVCQMLILPVICFLIA